MYTKNYATINRSTKGAAVMAELAAAEGPLTRKELAESVGCTVARVGEVIRALGESVDKVGNGYVLVSDERLPELSDGRSVAASDDATNEDGEQLQLAV